MPENLDQPLRWRKPRRVFVASMSDLLHEDVPFDYIGRVFGVMSVAQNHTFQVLTKRPERRFEFLEVFYSSGEDWYWRDWVLDKFGQGYSKQKFTGGGMEMQAHPGNPAFTEEFDLEIYPEPVRPLPNIWLGVTAENQKAADERIPLLLQCPAAVRFVSCEPLLGPIDIDEKHLMSCDGCGNQGSVAYAMEKPGCSLSGVAFFFKQWGRWAPIFDSYTSEDGYTMACIGKKDAGRKLDGREWNEYPEPRQ